MAFLQLDSTRGDRRTACSLMQGDALHCASLFEPTAEARILIQLPIENPLRERQPGIKSCGMQAARSLRWSYATRLPSLIPSLPFVVRCVFPFPSCKNHGASSSYSYSSFSPFASPLPSLLGPRRVASPHCRRPFFSVSQISRYPTLHYLFFLSRAHVT